VVKMAKEIIAYILRLPKNSTWADIVREIKDIKGGDKK
jgi:hypothetical protein